MIDAASNAVTTTITGLTGPYGLAFKPPPPTSDIDVGLTTQPHRAFRCPTSTTPPARNAGPTTLAPATLTAPPSVGVSAAGLTAGCTSATNTVTCAYGSIGAGASASKTFRIPLCLLMLGPITVTGMRTSSAPVDPNPANHSAATTCTAPSIVLVSCP
ncbi:hypothetical protein AB9128_09015 [Streptomyces cinereoruber]|uniref:hypothetical protein n=1 Tax=Streptomyces cinereoruber TaxID=67260 RepID=UPI003EBDED25